MFPEFLAEVDDLPDAGDADAAARGLDHWRAAAGAAPSDPERAVLRALCGNAPFLAQCAAQQPEVLKALFHLGPNRVLANTLDDMHAAVAASEGSDPTVWRLLRRARQRTALIVATADIAGLWDDRQVTAALSRFAEAAITLAVDHLLRQAAGAGELTLQNRTAPGVNSGLVVLAMGKLGGCELNYSSDVDLILFYDAETAPLTRRNAARKVFVKLAQRLARMLEERTGDGYVFRTDFRLRPDPAATPPAVSVTAAETYYESLGQNWERAAIIKARPIAGDLAAGDRFLRNIRPFVWRRHLDFAAIRDIQSIKRQIRSHNGGGEITIPGHDVKLGRGGIREIEFFAQTQQLIWGGRDPRLRERSTESALKALAAAGHASAETVAALIDSYWYLRHVEHRLQMVGDRQTHRLPDDPDGLARIATFLGHDDPAALTERLHRHLQRTATHCEALFQDSAPLGARLPGGGNLVFTSADSDPGTIATLTRMGFSEPETVSNTIRAWHHGRMPATRSVRARELLTELVPALLSALADTANPDQAFVRFDAFLHRLPAGVQLFSLFNARPQLLTLIAEIVGSAPRIAHHLSAHASVLDSVLTQGFFNDLPGAAACRRDLARALDSADDFQERIETARRWAADAKFRVSVQQLLGTRDATEAGAALSDIADTLLAAMLDAASREFAARHGRFGPSTGLAILGFGKLGSRILSRGSDLDLVFLYDSPGATALSDGARGLNPPAWYARLGQRLITAMSAPTGAGRLFSIDMRLRPMGDDGPLASDISGYERYFRENAWTWELMALTRARIVCAPPKLAPRIDALIRAILTRPRDPDKLVRDVVDMRRRIETEHRTRDPFAIKHVRGGLIDVEFIAQTLQLREAAQRPEVLRTGAVDALHALGAAGILSSAQTDTLTAAADLYYNVQAVRRLSLSGPLDEDTAPEGLRRVLARAGGVDSFSALKQRLAETQAEIHQLFNELVGRAANSN